MNAFMRSDLILKREASTSALVTSKGELSLPVPLRFERTALQFVSGETQHTCVEEACYSQLLEFYFCGTGRLSRFLDYSTLFAESAFPVRPEEVSVVLTKLCNMTCVHCYNDSGRKDSGELSDEQKIGLIEYLCRWGIRRLTITGGEPTLDPVLPACLDLATAFGVGVKLSTNGWHLSEAVLSSIRKKTVQQINISLDGADAKSHDSFRNKRGSFERVMKTLAVLREYQPRILVINASVHRGDIAQMDAVAGIAASVGATAVSFKPITSTGRSGVDTSFFLDETLLERFRTERNRLREKYRGQLEIDGKLIDASVGELIEDVACNAGRLAMMVDADGRMLPCESVSFLSDVPNCRDLSPMQAWLNSPLFHWFRDLSAASHGGCGTKGCPGSQIHNRVAGSARLVQLS